MITAVYEICNTVTGDKYVGITNNPRSRWASHCCEARRGKVDTRLYRSMRKHGVDSFEFRVLAGCPNRELALLAEQSLIRQTKPALNTSHGGDASPAKTSETRAKISAARKRKPQTQLQTPEARAKRITSMRKYHAERREAAGLVDTPERQAKRAYYRKYYRAKKAASA